jgi:hypothetical protein
MSSLLVAIIRDEVRNVGEWMLYHASLGFERILIYDHLSEDGMADEIRRVAALCPAKVDIVRWTDATQPQATAYRDAIKRNADPDLWMSFLDIDEFLVLPPGLLLDEFIATLDGNRAIAFNWKCYGSSGFEDYNPGLITQDLLWRAPDDYSANRHTKLLVQRGMIAQFMNPHYMILREGQYVMSDLKPAIWDKAGKLKAVPANLPAFINHYECRTRAHYNKKLTMPEVAKAQMPEDKWDRINRNDVYDPVLLERYASILNWIAERLGTPSPQAAIAL